MRIESIREILGIKEDFSQESYTGFDMSGYGEGDNRTKEGNIECKLKNFRLLKDNFPEQFSDLDWENFKLQTFKGCVHWGESGFDNQRYYEEENFSGWSTDDIVFWLIQNKPWIKEEEVSRVISKEKRYLVLKRQKWCCNICSERLKYNSDSDWKGEIAHIDHIHPFTKRKSYPNGIKNINELSNLQALCPDCNLKKGKKEIN